VVRISRDRLIVNPRTLADDELGPAVAALKTILE
jgi:hypothetical protein